MENVKTIIPMEQAAIFNNKQNKIAVYTICKNELQFVDKWLSYMCEADYMVILDTGSTDGTYEKFLERKKNYPNLIVRQKIINPWRFDTARNENLKDVPAAANILFEVDLDEIVRHGWSKSLRERWIDGVHERGEYRYAWSHLDTGEPGRIFNYNKIHSKNWIWKAPVHEYLINTKTGSVDYQQSQTITFNENEIFKEHFPDKTKSRSSYLGLLELRIKEDKNDFTGRVYYAHELSYSGKDKETINFIDKLFTDHGEEFNKDLFIKCDLLMFKAESYAKLHDLILAEKYFKEAMGVCETFREPYLSYATFLLSQDRYNETIDVVLNALKKSIHYYSWLERDASWNFEPYDILALAYFYRNTANDRLLSLAYAEKAYSLDTANERLKNNIQLILNNLDI